MSQSINPYPMHPVRLMQLRRAIQSEAELHKLERSVFQYLKRKGVGLKKRCHVLVGVSGGPDSVALLAVLLALEKFLGISKCSVAHFNHRLRKEAAEDENFVRELAARLRLDFFSGDDNVREYAGKKKISIEMAARECRYRFFFSLKEILRADYIALGHTGSDQAEEILLRLMRGTGPDGLSGMPVLSKNGILRPLLGVFRKDVTDYLREIDLPYRIDSTNFSPDFQRNRIRHEIIPLLSEITERPVEKILSRTAELFTEEAEFIDGLIDQEWNKLCVSSERDGQWIWNRRIFSSSHIAVQRRLIRKLVEKIRGNSYGLSFDHVENIRRFVVDAHSGSKLELFGIYGLIEGDLVRFSSENAIFRPPDRYCQVITSPGKYRINSTGDELILAFISEAEAVQVINRGSREEAVFDNDRIAWPLTLRFWQPGDRFQPLGMHGRSKKLQDFFTDMKIPLSRRHNIPILCDSEKICWIVGFRMDERVRVTEATKRFLHIRYIRSCNPPQAQGDCPVVDQDAYIE